MTEEQRSEIARILETVAKDGLPSPRDLDAALDAIEEVVKLRTDTLENAVSTLLLNVVPNARDTGHNAVDRDMNEAIKFAKAAIEKKS